LQNAKENCGQLLVIPTDPALPPLVVPDNSCSYPDWTADSQSVVYVSADAAPAGEGKLRVGRLTRRRIFDSDGHLAKDATNEVLAELLFDDDTGVRCLRDGRILFLAAADQQRDPATNTSNHPDLFVLDPGRSTTASRLMPRLAEETFANAGFYDVSPDEKRLLVASDKCAVSVVTLATGEVAVVQSSGNDDVSSLPSWRGNEVCFIATTPANEKGHTNEFALWKSDHAVRYLSSNWPAGLRKELLDK